MTADATRLLIKRAGDKLPSKFALAPYVGERVIVSTGLTGIDGTQERHHVGRLIGVEFYGAPDTLLSLWLEHSTEDGIPVSRDQEFTIEIAPSFTVQ